MAETLELRFGALAPPLREQLVEQGHEISEYSSADLQADADAITRLYLRGLLRKGEVDTARRRLVRSVQEVLAVLAGNAEVQDG